MQLALAKGSSISVAKRKGFFSPEMMTAWLTFTTGRLYASLWLYKRLLALEHNREDPTLVLARDPSGALLLHSKLLLMAEFLLFNKIPEKERKRKKIFRFVCLRMRNVCTYILRSGYYAKGYDSCQREP